MRRFFLGCCLAAVCILPLALGSVGAGLGRRPSAGMIAAAATNPSITRTVARNVSAGGLAVDAAGKIYFTANDRLYRISSDMRIAADGRASADRSPNVIAGTGQRGFLGDGGPAALAEFNLLSTSASPSVSSNGNLSADLAGNLFLADTLNDTVRRVGADSNLISSVAGRWATGVNAAGASGEIVKPGLVAADTSGGLFIAGSDALWRLDSSAALSLIAAVMNPAALAVSRDGGTVAVALSGGKMLLVLERTDASHYRAAFTLPAGAKIPESDPGLTQRRDGGEESDSAAPRFSGLAIDAAGNIFIAERTANVIQKVDRETLEIATIAGTGRAGYSGDGGAPLRAEFNAPGSLAIDRDGNLFVADLGNSAIREVTHAAAAAGVTLAPNTFTFPSEPTGGASAAQMFTLTNNSSTQVSGISIEFAGGSTPPDFSETSTCATALDAGASCNISVVFMPQVAGQRSAALHVSDSDPSSPQTAALSGFADDYGLAVQSGNTDTLTVLAGATANYNLAVVPDATFSGTVTIQCPLGLPANTTCALAPGTASSAAAASSGMTSLDLDVTAGTPQNFTMSLATTAKVVAPYDPTRIQWPHFPARSGEILAIVTLLLLFAAWRKRKRAVGLAFSAVLMIAAVGCSSSYSNTPKTTKNPGTPAGTFNLNVRGDSQGASRAITVTLIVQA